MYDIYSVVPEEKRILINSPILLRKAIKNEVFRANDNYSENDTYILKTQWIQIHLKIQKQVEVNGMMEAHARDSAALCSWAAMMEQQVKSIVFLLLLIIIIIAIVIIITTETGQEWSLGCWCWWFGWLDEMESRSDFLLYRNLKRAKPTFLNF